MNKQTSTKSRFAAVWALQCFGALALLGIGYWWLTWPDEHAWQVFSSAVVALLVLGALIWLERTVFSCVDQKRNPPIAPRAITSHAFFSLWLVCFGLLEAMVVSFWASTEQIAVRIAQVLHLPPRATTSVLDWATWGVVWILLPALLLPFGSAISRPGIASSRTALLVLRKPRYLVGVGSALLVGIYIPRVLIHWTPERVTLNGEMWSAVVRIGVAYLLAVSALVFVAWNTAQTLPLTPLDSATETKSATA